MEAALFVLNSLAVLVLVVTSLLNDGRKPGRPLRGPFSYHEETPVETPSAAVPARGWRGRRRADA